MKQCLQSLLELGNRICEPVHRLVLFLVVFLICLQGVSAGESSPAVVRTAFGEDCEKMVISEVSKAKKEILVAIYSLTRRNINSAFVQAVKRGVSVTVKYDARQEDLEAMKDSIDYLKKHDVKCVAIKFSDEHGAMHHKFMVIDRKTVLTGSYNYTVPATILNYENLVSIESSETVAAFIKEFERIKDR